MGKREASHFITEYYTEGGKVELMIPTDATYDDFALLKGILAIVETKLKQRADRNSSGKPNNSTRSKKEIVESEGDMKTYGLERDGDTIKFYCDDDYVLENICDYISRFIDAENYRRQFIKVKRIECADDD